MNGIAEKIVSRLITLIQQQGVLCDGVLDFLETCHQYSLNMAICSSSDLKIIQAVVDTFHLQKYFPYVHSAQFETYGKPHPSAYLSTMQHFGVSPKNCVVFEDSINGAIAGKASGATLVVIPSMPNQKQHMAFADYMYNSFTSVQVSDILQIQT